MKVLMLIAIVGVALGACKSLDSAATSEQKSVFDAEGQRLPDHDADSNRVAWRPLRREADGITGVGVLNAPILLAIPDICTASLIDTGATTGPAYVLTNSHCTFFEHWGFDPLKPDEFRTDRATSYYVTFNHFAGVPADLRMRYKLRRLTYTTEAGMDVAIMEVEATVAELLAKGIKPLKLRAKRPPFGEPVRLIGVPLVLVSEEKMTLQISECTIGRVAKLRNGIYSAPESVVHRCSSVPGFSGGPLLDAAGGIVLLNSHGATEDSSDPPCTYATRPCEVMPDGSEVVVVEANYGQYVDRMAGCFGPDGRFDLARPDCRLPK